MTNLVRIRKHPSDPAAVILDIPYELNHELRKFGPAILAPELKGFVLLVEHLDSFERFAKTIHAHIIDERQTPDGPRPLMPECKHCAQPARLTAQPKHCPSCGRRWEAKFIDGRNNEHDSPTKQCVRCGREQLRAFGYCGQCGEVMPPDDDTPPRRLVLPRTNLDDPMALSDVMRETVDGLDDGPTTAEWAQLVRLEIRPCKSQDHTVERARKHAVTVELPSEERAL